MYVKSNKELQLKPQLDEMEFSSDIAPQLNYQIQHPAIEIQQVSIQLDSSALPQTEINNTFEDLREIQIIDMEKDEISKHGNFIMHDT